MTTRILLLEDDEKLGAQIVEHLRRAGFEVDLRAEGAVLSSEDTANVSLLILDLMLPGVYGMDVLRALRKSCDVPVLILSARMDAADKVRALKLGADDYMTKPFWPEELVERVKARLRRPTMQKSSGALRAGPLSLDAETREARLDGATLELTRVEFELLAALVRRPGQALTRQWLVSQVLDPDRDGTERTLDVHVSRLRKKLGAVQLIETVWGIGYRLKVEAP
ncbi:MAG TPA: response regulator transcription factor [Myxococcales bacterium]|jgi:two-component system response regulator MtrA